MSVSDRVLTPEDADDIKQKLRSAEGKFYLLGMKLLEMKEANDITLAHLDTYGSLSEVIDKFLEYEEKEPTWSKIFEALRSPGVGLEQLATNLQTDLQVYYKLSVAEQLQFMSMQQWHQSIHQLWQKLVSCLAVTSNNT